MRKQKRKSHLPKQLETNQLYILGAGEGMHGVDGEVLREKKKRAEVEQAWTKLISFKYREKKCMEKEKKKKKKRHTTNQTTNSHLNQ